MRPLLHAVLVNGRWGDPAVYVEALFERRALLFDLGSIENLPPRKILRLTHVFVSHAHVDHLVGFDRLLRTLVGRDKKLCLYGPEPFVDHVHHKLHGYCWNLGKGYPLDLEFLVTEIGALKRTRSARFRLRNAFAEEPIGEGLAADGVICSEPGFRASVAILDHRIPCLGFAIEEPVHVNVRKSRLEVRGLPVGPWLRDLKHAIAANQDDEYLIDVGGKPHGPIPLGALRDLATVTIGQKIGYITDIADTPANAAAVIDLVRHADILFIEAPFRRADAALAAGRAHLTTAAAGRMAREAGVRRLEPFHFSSRYEGQEADLMRELMQAFGGEPASVSNAAAGGRAGHDAAM
jgi:ribonuclease Z